MKMTAFNDNRKMLLIVAAALMALCLLNSDHVLLCASALPVPSSLAKPKQQQQRMGGPNNGNNVRKLLQVRTTCSWTQIGEDINGEAARDEFGCSVALSVDGSTMAVGAP